MIAETIIVTAGMMMLGVFIFRRGLRTAWTEWLAHREAMRSVEVDDEVVEIVKAYAIDIHEKALAMVFDVRNRMNSEVGS